MSLLTILLRKEEVSYYVESPFELKKVDRLFLSSVMASLPHHGTGCALWRWWWSSSQLFW